MADSPRRSRVGGPVRICMVTSFLPQGGAESVQLAVLGGLDPERFSCQILCLREDGVMADSFRRAGVPVTSLGRHRAQHLWSVPVVASWLRDQRIDVMLATAHIPSLHICLPAARLGGVRGSVLGIHIAGGIDHGLGTFPRGSLDLMWLLDALVVVSHEQREYIAEREGFGRLPWRSAPTALIPNGVPVPPPPTADDRRRARATLGVPPDAPVVGCVAALRREKDHPMLLRATRHLAERHPGLRMLLIGDGPDRASIEAGIADAGLGDTVIVTGFRDDVPALLPGLDVACLTSIFETYPVAPLEAMAAGVPVVMTHGPGRPLLVDEGLTGHTVAVGDDAALAERIGALLDAPDLRDRMGAAGREVVERRHSQDLMIARYAALFEHLAHHRRGARGMRRLPVAALPR